MMRLVRLFSLCIVLWGMGVSPVIAQQKPTPLPEYAWGSPVLVPTLPSAGFAQGTTQGAIWSGVGVAAGSVASFFPTLFAALALCEPDRTSEATCSLAVVPLGIGNALGAAFGAETGGDRQAWGRTLAGAAIGTAAAMGIVVLQADLGFLGLLAPPAVGAWVGNRLGQR